MPAAVTESRRPGRGTGAGMAVGGGETSPGRRGPGAGSRSGRGRCSEVASRALGEVSADSARGSTFSERRGPRERGALSARVPAVAGLEGGDGRPEPHPGAAAWPRPPGALRGARRGSGPGRRKSLALSTAPRQSGRGARAVEERGTGRGSAGAEGRGGGAKAAGRTPGPPGEGGPAPSRAGGRSLRRSRRGRAGEERVPPRGGGAGAPQRSRVAAERPAPSAGASAQGGDTSADASRTAHAGRRSRAAALRLAPGRRPFKAGPGACQEVSRGPAPAGRRPGTSGGCEQSLVVASPPGLSRARARGPSDRPRLPAPRPTPPFSCPLLPSPC